MRDGLWLVTISAPFSLSHPGPVCLKPGTLRHPICRFLSSLSHSSMRPPQSSASPTALKQQQIGELSPEHRSPTYDNRTIWLSLGPDHQPDTQAYPQGQLGLLPGRGLSQSQHSKQPHLVTKIRYGHCLEHPWLRNSPIDVLQRVLHVVLCGGERHSLVDRCGSDLGHDKDRIVVTAGVVWVWRRD